MSRELVCIVCPVGCSLVVEDGEALVVTGNRCPRGAVYAQEEVKAPKRTVTATCAVSNSGHGFSAPRRVPVKTSAPCPKEKIPALLHDMYHTKITLPVTAGDTVIANWQGCGIDVVVTRGMNVLQTAR